MLLLLLIQYAFAMIYYLDTDQFPRKLEYSPLNVRLEKRQVTSLFTRIERTKSIELTFNCVHPFQETDFENGRCAEYAEALVHAAEILESHIVFKNMIRIETEMKPFCNDVDPDPFNFGKPCLYEDKTLGRAAPTAMYTFNETIAKSVGLDHQYGYPTSLARQFVPNDPTLPTFDITATFNSGYNWKLPSNSNPQWGRAISINGGFLNQTNQVSFDLIQVALHEYIHGLGFISSWTEYREMFFPSYLSFDNWGRVNGILPAWIYTKYMSDRVTGIWLDSYRQIIQTSMNQAIRNATNLNPFENIYKKSVGHKIGLAVYNLFVTPQSILIWFPSNQGILKYGVIYTPRSFSTGSSVSHLDSDTYSGLGSFLLRPTATGGIEWNRKIPNSRNPLGNTVLGIFRAMGYTVLLEM